MMTQRPRVHPISLSSPNMADYSTMSFPCKLYAMLEDADAKGFEDVISWQHGGRSFKVYNPDYFAHHVMQGYFAQTKFKSFQRQLNIYGWKKVHHGPNKGGYVHRSFVRGQPDLCNKIARRSGSKDMGNPLDSENPTLGVQDPFVVFQGEHVIVPVEYASHAGQVQSHSSSSDGGESEIDTIMNVFEPPQGNVNHQRSRKASSFQNQPNVGHWRINTADLDLRLDDDDLDGFVALLDQEGSAADPEVPHPFKAVVEEENTPTGSVHSDSDNSLETDHNFPFKLHLMLESAEKDGYANIVSWVKKGTAFKVWNNKEFVDKVLPYYFDQSKYESFRRQLNLYGYIRVARGSDRGVISHPFFVQGDRGLCKQIKRKPQPKGGAAKASHPVISAGGAGVPVLASASPPITV